MVTSLVRSMTVAALKRFAFAKTSQYIGLVENAKRFRAATVMERIRTREREVTRRAKARRRARRAGPTVVLSVMLLCTALAAELPYPEQIAKFRVEREQEIRADWLPLVGLYWLKEGDNAVGSNPKSEVILPASSPALVGTLSFLKAKVFFKPAGAAY